MARSSTQSRSIPARRTAPTAARWARIRLFAMDVDGVLTDGSIYVSSDGAEMKRFSVLDGMGLGRLRDAGIALAWISAGTPVPPPAAARSSESPISSRAAPTKLAALQELAPASRSHRRTSATWATTTSTPRDLLGRHRRGPAAAMPAALTVADYVPARPAGAAPSAKSANTSSPIAPRN
jgi:3-deoxy-D-manno-octulosonate 8-phosphate phosphatase (KDO 8-P phosphatase)